MFGAGVLAVLTASSATAQAEEAWALPASDTSTASPPASKPALTGPDRLELRGTQVILRAQGGLAGGALPGSGPVLSLRGALRVAPVRYVIHGRLRLSRETDIPDSLGRVASVELWTVGARVCPELEVVSAWFVEGCAGAEAGRFRAEEEGRGATELWAGAFISGAVRADIAPRFALWAGSDLGLTFVDAEYDPEQAGALSTGLVFWTVEVGVEVHLD